MLLSIHDNALVSDLQDHFTTCFPGLTLRFYRHPHRAGVASPEGEHIDGHERLGAIRKKGADGALQVLSSWTVKQLEHTLEKDYGLHAQVLRCENGDWIQTTSTDHYTLRQQSEMSAHARHSIDPKYKDQLREYGDL